MREFIVWVKKQRLTNLTGKTFTISQELKQWTQRSIIHNTINKMEYRKASVIIYFEIISVSEVTALHIASFLIWLRQLNLPDICMYFKVDIYSATTVTNYK